MKLSDTLIVIIFIIAVIVFLILFSSKENRKNYFLSGNGLSWPLIGISIIAANISTEQFIGMAGSGYTHGLAIASHEWTAVIALVILSLYILPKFMSAGIKTLPEYLEYRFNHWARLLMGICMILFTLFIQFASIIYSGSIVIETMFHIDRTWGIISLCLLSAFFTLIKGLSSVAYSNLIFVITFLIGGLIISCIGITQVGGFTSFIHKSEGKLVALLPANDGFMPWTSVLFGGLWVAQFYYFGFNQFITQYLLGGRSLSDAQKGILLAASIKLLIPFIAVIPGIIAFEIFGGGIKDPDLAYPMLIEFLSEGRDGLKGIVFCTIAAAIITTLNSMLTASSDIFINDIYLRYINKNASEEIILRVSKITTLLFIITGCLWAPYISTFNGSFEYAQRFSGMISPGILSVYLLALFTKKVPSFVAILTLVLNIPIYFIYIRIFPVFSFYNILGMTFVSLMFFSLILGAIFPLEKRVKIPEKFEIKFERNLLVVIWSIFLITALLFIYVLFV